MAHPRPKIKHVASTGSNTDSEVIELMEANEAVEVIEAVEVFRVLEVIEAVKVIRALEVIEAVFVKSLNLKQKILQYTSGFFSSCFHFSADRSS